MSSSLSLHEMLEKFIEPEKLEGKQYKCEQCGPKVGLQGAEKQFLIDKPPDVLRFHLKRFYWSSRDRHKISTHVSFPLQLDIRPYCSSSSFQSSSAPTSSTSTVVPSAAQGSRKTLSSVVIQPSKNPNAPPTPKVSFDLSSSVFTYPSEQSELRSSNARIQQVSVLVPVVSLNSKSPNHVSQPSPSSTSMISTDSEMKSLNKEGGQSSLSGGCPGNGCHGCTRDPQEGLLYHLSSVVVHHGAGFQSGHYTAYCWNAEAESWIHCNDARIMRCSEAELAACQAYILFYSLAQPANDCSGVSSSCEPVTKKRRLT